MLEHLLLSSESMKRLSLLLLLTLGAPLAACGNTDAKGGEDNALAEDGKFDSWFVPTEHGEMRFVAPNDAALQDGQLFHSWTFTLSGDAEIDLHIEGGVNLDTVMYLYRRDSSEEEWGRYARRNDDDGDLVTSRITHDATAGEYRVIVKGYKTQLRGEFRLFGECSGDGCTTSTDMCVADEYQSLPADRSWSLDCAYGITGILNGGRTYLSMTGIDFADKCNLVGLERAAADYYYEYWTGITDWDEQFDADGEGVYLELETYEFSGGVSIYVSAGFDEDGLELFFDDEGTLLASYQHNQSPTVDYYCADDGAGLEAPDEACFETLFQVLPREEESPRESGNADIADGEAIHPGLGAAIAAFISDAGLESDEVVEYEFVAWESVEGQEGLAANLVGPDDISAEYTMYGSRGEWVTLYTTDANGIVMVCER